MARELLLARVEALRGVLRERNGAAAFVPDTEVERIVSGEGPGLGAALAAPPLGPEAGPLGELVRRLGLSADSAALVALMFAVERDPFARELALDVAREPIVPGLTPLALADLASRGDLARQRALLAAFLPAGELARHRLVRASRGLAPTRTRERVSLDPVVADLLAGVRADRLWADEDGPGAVSSEQLDLADVAADEATLDTVRNALTLAASRDRASPRLALAGPDAGLVRRLVRALVTPRGEPLLTWRAPPSAKPNELSERLQLAVRDAELLGAVLLVERAETLLAGDNPRLHELIGCLEAFRGPLVLSLDTLRPEVWGLGDRVVAVRLPPSSAESQIAALTAALGDHPGAEASARAVAPRYTLTDALVAQIAAEARLASGPEPITEARLAMAARARIGAQIGRFADAVTLGHGLDDLELPDEARDSLRELIDAWRLRGRVLDGWGFGGRIPEARSLAALFHGPPGTGKTMAAGVVARALGMELYRIELSRVVDKYIGETEKHLARAFDEAERGQLVLLFDEADSLFAKRTGIESSTDRYANLEVNFLLQRLERHSGLVILTSNHDALIDPAFKRRLRYRIHFPMPDAAERARLWQGLVPPACPTAGALDFELLGEDFEMSGGHIRNAVIRAAYRSADAGLALSTEALVEAAKSEYRAMGRLVRDLR